MSRMTRCVSHPAWDTRALHLAPIQPEACLPRADDGLRPVGHLELAQDVGDMVAHGFGAQHEAGGDFGVLLALGDQVEDLPFAVAELREHPRQGSGSKAGEELHQPSGDSWAEDSFALANRADGTR